MSTMLTLFLASVAFLFVVNDKLPRIPYLTIMDKLTIGCFFLLFLVAFENFLSFVMVYHFARQDISAYLDFCSRFLFPAFHIVFIWGLAGYGFLRETYTSHVKKH